MGVRHIPALPCPGSPPPLPPLPFPNHPLPARGQCLSAHQDVFPPKPNSAFPELLPRAADGALLLCLILGWFVLVFFHRARSPSPKSWIELGLIRALLPERDVPFKIPNPEGLLEFGSRYWIFTISF